MGFMDLFKAIETRRSVRRYGAEDVADDVVLRVVRAGHMAPSAGNLQARDFIVIRDGAKKKALAEAAFDQGFVARAPVVIAVCGNLKRIAPYGKRGTELYVYHDVAAAVENMLLAAHALGLGACWVGAFDDDAVREILALPSHAVPMALIPLGHPESEPSSGSGAKRLPLDQVLHRGEEW